MTTETKYEEARSTDSASSDEHAASRNLDDTADALKNTANGMLDDAKEAAVSRLSQEKEGAASGIDHVANALRDVVKRHDEGSGSDLLTNLAGSAADGLERLSSDLRNKDVGTMLRDVQSFARDQPVAFFGLTMAAGFLAGRFLKASESESANESTESDSSARHGAQQTDGNGRQEETWTNR